MLYKTYADLKAEAARTYISFMWWILDPLLYMAVFYIVFDVLLKRGTDNFISFLLVGLVLWKWFASSIQHALNSISIHRGLIQQIYLPKWLFPVITVLTDLVKFIIIFMILLVLLLIIGVMPGIAWINLPILIMCQLLFIMGCSCLAAAITPFFPDFRLLTESGLTLMMFLSGIFYESKTIPINFQVFFFANPMAVMIDAFRITLLENRHPNWLLISYVFFISNVLLAVALNILKRFDRVYPRMTFA
ncbi:MAG: ABC transporter permease [Candidatus Competibacteraceae bacterium]|nr:ABC transporter permease [Candidatus Competibacteraceae bacterium]